MKIKGRHAIAGIALGYVLTSALASLVRTGLALWVHHRHPTPTVEPGTITLGPMTEEQQAEYREAHRQMELLVPLADAAELPLAAEWARQALALHPGV